MTPRPLRRPALGAALVGLLCGSVCAADAFIMPDGFSVQGRVSKEQGSEKNYGFDVIRDGPKVIVFSPHAKKGAKVEKDLPGDKATAYKRPWPGTKGQPPPPAGELKVGPFDDKWYRTLKVTQPNGYFHEVRQFIRYIDPYALQIASTTHNWATDYHTAELGPAAVRKLLVTHPDLQIDPAKPEPMRRVLLAAFMKEAGWYPEARYELEQARRDYPNEWPKDAADRAASLRTEIDLADTRRTLEDLEAAIAAGQYAIAADFAARFQPPAAEPADATKLGVLRSRAESGIERTESARALLRELAREVAGEAPTAADALLGCAGAAAWPRPRAADPVLRTVADAAKAVANELHPDGMVRVDLFANLARRGAKGGGKPAELLALAVSGWLKGKNGADPNPAAAARCWDARRTMTAYLADDVLNDRATILKEYAARSPLAADELAQIVTLMPPAEALDLSKPPGVEVPPTEKQPPGVFRRVAPGASPGEPGVDYCLRLPPEYRHGRSYPLILAMTHSNIEPEKIVGSLAAMADKLGYVVAAPAWANQFSGPYDWSGKEHPLALAVLRDVLRKVQADPDRVFAFGFGEGANYAMDVAISHPDHFAGTVLMGPSPNPDLMMHYWANAQKLPHYVVTGEMAGGSFAGLRKVYEKWMPKGFPALLTMYRGRGVEWFGQELPRIFDWMGRKTRARGTAALRLNAATFEPWVTGRAADNRFYWVGAGEIQPRYVIERTGFKGGFVPATLSADLRQGNEVVVTTRGLKTVTVWLERDLIDWTRPVRVQVNGQAPYRYAPKVPTPDPGLMLEEVYRTGDRKMLFLGKLEFPAL